MFLWRKCRLPIVAASLCCLFLFNSGCQELAPRDELDTIKARGKLRVLMRNNATCYYEGAHGPTGFEYDLVRGFADYLGVKVVPVVTDKLQEMVPSLLRGDADLIAAGFSRTLERRLRLSFGPSYMEVEQQVVGRRGGPSPHKIADLVGQSLWVNAGSAYEERLRELKKKYPALSWMSISGYETEELLEMVWKGIIPLTIADSNIIAVNRRYYPQLVILFSIGKPQQLAWAMHPQHRHLRHAVDNWFTRPQTHALIQQLSERYYGHLEVFDYVDLVKYHRRVRHRLQRYQKYFEAAADKYGFDWRLVAAQAYQESHWNPRARSFTGVRGIMMLTLDTAEYLGIESRLDPRQAIFGGVRYLADLHKRIGPEVVEPDRTYMALAAYNVGWGHLQDARELCERMGKNPNSWQDVRATLPLLRQKKYYRTLKHGYARGTEPVRYVDRIRTYYKILVQATEQAGKRKGAKEDTLSRMAEYWWLAQNG
ncbi:MAG: membrane-bound lytic murein transglycosylase MltF [Deltaproteobacteria bacterium]|nr:membrane-bound lytic murein transglycosylase MltF [Deltaproteobacteria bacterium]MBW2071501.1 membrane-bound lytic murein transglycosylase MltF [Deltaproteobacteria bacterium]